MGPFWSDLYAAILAVTTIEKMLSKTVKVPTPKTSKPVRKITGVRILA